MEKWKKSFTIAVILVIVTCSTVAAFKKNPLKDPRICGRPTCSDLNNKFKYHVHSLYKFDYSMHVRTEFSGSGDNSSELHVASVVEIDFPEPCQGVMKMYTIEVRERMHVSSEESNFDYGEDYNAGPPETVGELHPKSETIGEQLMRFDLKFAFHDGTIGEICHEEDEPIWTLNLKRGILSAFQNTMPRFDIDYQTTETDVSGICDVQYAMNGTRDTSLLIKKTKDITSCKRRYKTSSVIQTVPYDFRPNYVAWPILNSTSYCDIAVDNFVYKKVECYERHQLVPFSNQQAGAVTETYTKLELADAEAYLPETNAEEPLEIQKRSSLLYDHTPSLRDSHDEIKASRELLKQLCELGFPDIKRTFPDVFLNFLTTARALSYNALYQLFSRSRSICNNGRNHILESLPYIGSAASVTLMKEQIVKDEIPTELARKWMESFAYLTRPDEEVLEAMLELIEHGKKIGDRTYTLAATAVVHTFCNIQADCADSEAVQGIVNFLEYDLLENINQPLDGNPALREGVIVLLKGLGNIGVINQVFYYQLRGIIEEKKLPTEIRVEAVNSFRRHVCHRTKDYFLKLYSNFEEDVEVRIASYLQAMRCPDYLSVKMVKHVLKTEEVNQAGSFVWSHLTNLANSASPVRVEAQGLLADDDLSRKFRLDLRKFSRNYEQTLFFDEYNFGMTTDANLVFGTESYLPRTLRVNLTADLFGESVNFLELNMRAEGFEYIVESFFGPTGPLNSKKVKEYTSKVTKLFDFGSSEEDQILYEPANEKSKRETVEDESDRTERQKRDATRSPTLIARELQSNVDQLGYRMKTDFQNPHASLGVKIFGNELQYHTIDGIAQTWQAIQRLNILKDLFSGKEVSYTKSGVFLDASYDVPLSSGLPLSLSVIGASSVDMRMSGTLRTFEFWEGLVDVEGKVKPSVSVDVTATMKSDFMFASTYIKVKSNLYSSSAWETKLKVRGNKLATLQLSLPQDRNEIFSIRSEMFVAGEGREIRQDGIEKRYANSTCTSPLIDRAVGLKLCANYSLPDVSNNTKVPSLILSGPVNLDVSLEKADLTAKLYLLKYSWDTRQNKSIGSLVFETPNSQIPRIFTANLTAEAERYSLTMGFLNGNISHSAVGIYIDNKDQRRLDMSLNVNDRKYLAVEMGYNRTEVKYGMVYNPSFYLSVNNERIAGMAGQVKLMDKKGIVQWDYTLTFETKRVQAKVMGYIYKTQASITNKLSMDYRFINSKLEHLVISSVFSDRGNRGHTEYHGSFDLRSSAYPHFDFASNMKFLSAMAHVECKVEYNNAKDLKDPRYTTTVRFIFARSAQPEMARTTASLELTRPLSRVDWKGMIKHENNLRKGLEHNVLLLMRYATGKEVTGVFSVYFPRGHLFAIDTAANVTVPGFHPCTVNFKIREKARKEYYFDFKGVWFSAHLIKVNGLYQDRSSVIKSYHHAKLDAQSPSFGEVTGDLKYVRDEYENRFDVHAKYDDQPYGLSLRYTQEPENGTSSYAEFQWKESLYWFSSLMKTAPIKQLNLELHIDKVRDISVILRGYSTLSKREIGVELKWDANRDPTQRLAVSGELNTPVARTYDGRFLISYPNRTFSGTFDLNAIDNYLANARVSWNTSEVIEVQLDAGSDEEILRNMWLFFKLTTPFSGWRYNALNGGFYFKDNLLKTNISARWAENQNLGLEVMGLYLSNDKNFSCELKTKLHSSIQHVPTVKLHLSHKYDAKRVDTSFTVNHTVTDEPSQVFSVRSGWQYDVDEQYRNISGSLALISPFEGYKTGALVTKFSLSESRELRGAADLQLDDDLYEMTVRGHVRNLVDCLLTVNITSSNENFRNIHGRFGISERERHVVAEVITPKSALGVEILYAVVSAYNFDVKFHLATPLKELEKVIVRGKLQSDHVDFRVGMNSIILGCVGVWRKADLQDFEYSYKIFTPLQKFEESSLILKLIMNKEKREYIDLEFSGKFSEYKLGVKAVSEPKAQLIRQLGLPKPLELLDSVLEDMYPEATESEEEMEDDEEDLLNFIGAIEIDTIVFPTITGILDLEEYKSKYYAIGKLRLPQGDIEIRDRFWLEDFMNMKNNLRIRTPFPVAKEITSSFELKIPYPAHNVIVGMNVKFLNNIEWVNTGFHVNYLYSKDEAEMQTHRAVVNLMTPMQNLKKVRLDGVLDVEEHGYKGNLTAKTTTTEASLALAFEREEDFIDSQLTIWVRAPLMPYYACRVFYKQDFSATDNSMDMGFVVNDGDMYSNFRLDGVWSLSNPHFIDGKGKYQSNFFPIQQINTDILITRTPYPKAHVRLRYNDSAGVVDEIHATAFRNREMFTIELSVPIEEYRNLSLYGRLLHKGGYDYMVSGQMSRNDEVFHLEGKATIVDDVPNNVQLAFHPLGNGLDGTIHYHYETEPGVTAFNVKLERGDRVGTMDGGFKLLAMSDWKVDLGIVSSEKDIAKVDFFVGILPEDDGKALGRLTLRSPWKRYGMDQADIKMLFDVQPISGSVVAEYTVPNVAGNASCLWNWELMSNMQFALENQVERNTVQRTFRTGVRYLSPDKQNNHNVTFGGDLNLNNLWIFSANASVDFISLRDLSGVLKVQLPKPVGDIHTLAAAMNGNIPFVEPMKTYNIETSYETEESRKRYAWHSEYSYVGDLRTLVRFEWGPDIRSQRVQSNLEIFRNGERRELSARLRGPWYLEDALKASGSYDLADSLHLVSGNLSIPASNKVAEANVAFNNLSNMKGDVNCTTTFLNITWLHGQLEFIETPLESIRYMKATWPESTAVFDAKSTYSSNNMDRNQHGTIKIEVPLQSKHYAEVKYGLAQRPAITTGHAEVEYNSRKVLSGQYTSKEESRAGFDKETIDVTLENDFKPVGVHYVHSTTLLGSGYNSLDVKRAEVFELRNQKRFNITGELQVTNTETGREYVVRAIHPNRTVILTMDFDELDNTSRQKSKLQLSPKVWLAYDFRLVNRSTAECESQNFTLQISYPKRNLSADGWYSYTTNNFDSDVALTYTPNKTRDQDAPSQRTVRGAIKWRDRSSERVTRQDLLVALGHPSFEKDITVDAKYYSDAKDWVKTNLNLQYTDDDEHLVAMAFNLKDLSSVVHYWNYSYLVDCVHGASYLNLNSIGSIGLRKGLYGINSNSYYKRAYLSQMEGHLVGLLNLQQKEVTYERFTSQSKYRLWSKASGSYPIYRINGTLLDGPERDAAGFFFLDLDDKVIEMKINMTPDASENIFMYGVIPDSRSAYFDFWRDYDTSREVDVAYYLKMNHSRLVTSHLIWRPAIREDVRNLVRDYFNSLHNSFTEYMEFWVKQMYQESKDSISGIYDSAQPYLDGFLDDVSGMNVIQDDLEALRQFLNASYVADDFYIRSVINFTVTVLDELAIKNKITSLPKILTELWQVMGDSSEALKKSLTWLLETLKQSYQKLVDVIGRIFQGDSMKYLSEALENSVAKYDRFIKDVHLQFVKNVQDLWRKFTEMITSYWHKMLQNIEPSIIRLAHYGESMTWHVGHEVFTFLYNKTQEIAESPYFTTVSNFTQDLDTLYRDLVTNDIVTNIKKYSSVVVRFAKEKYFRLVPFGKEFHQILTELIEEIKQLQKHEFVQYFLQRIEEARAKVDWLAEEFQVERRLHQLWQIIRNKLSYYAQTALQAENRYREAKTKFIFDPDNGVMELEQKLPMSWHAFNETPKFEEIPEYKLLTDIQNFFAGSNTTIWTLYNEVKPFADTRMWLPPFKSNALLVGSRHYMTFDKRFISMDLRELQRDGVSNKCSYLLAHDFYNRTFSLLLEPSVLQRDQRSSRKLTLVTDDHVLEIDISDVSVKINRNETTSLPALIGETVVYREADMLNIHSQKGFRLTCSLRYSMCSLYLSGWYFGKTAGILGTMNNEVYDDYTTSRSSYARSKEEFTNSWALQGCSATVGITNHTKNYYAISNELSQLCESFFRMKHSYFTSCFSVVDATPFYEMCVDLGHHIALDEGDPSNRGACTAALAYMEACALEDIPLRVPDSCIHCKLLNGSYVPEGSFVSMKDNEAPSTSDVVFIVEAKPCNEKIVPAKSMTTLVQTLHKELLELNITDNRYGVVAFGGAQPFDRPHSVIVNNNVFVTHEHLEPFFQYIATGNGTNDDIYDAIITASKLVFRPGASKTFILLPCSRCAASSMRLDYSSLLQLLLENGITLHILTDQEIEFDKSRVSRLFYGMDREKAYTKKDMKELIGDADLRKQIRLPKTAIGSCSALALETDGSVFGGRKLRPERWNTTKKFIKVFAKRVAHTAVPKSCQTCECTGHNTGVSYMLCLPCTYPSVFGMDNGQLNEDEWLSVYQPEHVWDWDEDDEML